MKGYVQVYTGDGKGKTTAAIGLAIRAIGAGKKVLLLQFMKSLAYAEQKVLCELPNITLETVGKPFFIIPEGMKTKEELERWGDDVVIFEKGNPPVEYVELIHKGYTRAMEAVESNEFDIVILDEVNMAFFFGLLSEEEGQELLNKRNEGVELVCTGRGAPAWLVERADLVTEMKMCKHYYEAGINARVGIEH